jgi:hypothetical protein
MGRPKSDYSDLGSYDCQTRQKPSLVAHQLSGGGSNLLVEATVQGMSARLSWLSRQIGAIVGAGLVLWGWREIRL